MYFKFFLLVSEKIFIKVFFITLISILFWWINALAISRKYYCVILSGLIWVQTVISWQAQIQKAQIQKVLTEEIQLNSDNFISWWGREDPITTKRGRSLARQKNTIYQ